MKLVQFKWCALLLTLLFVTACTTTSTDPGEDNSIYYWRTVFSLSPQEREFLSKHNVTKIYMRFFDVTWSNRETTGDIIEPNATIAFEDSVPEGIEIVPTVYITNNAIDQIQREESEYAQKILRRIIAMCKHHNIDFKEIQLDCDWTNRTCVFFYDLCKAMKEQLDSGQMLSSTIRLHQLTQPVPPVDRGVLMVYNTGNLRDMTTENSIFSYDDISPYLADNRLGNYDLPLDVAYPAYGWSLVFYYDYYEGQYSFNRIMKRTDFNDYPDLKEIKPNWYEATDLINFSPDNSWVDCVSEGSLIRVERPTTSEILKIKKLIDAQLGDKKHSNILYHLDNSQLSHFSDDEINQIYTRN